MTKNVISRFRLSPQDAFPVPVFDEKCHFFDNLTLSSFLQNKMIFQKKNNRIHHFFRKSEILLPEIPMLENFEEKLDFS